MRKVLLAIVSAAMVASLGLLIIGCSSSSLVGSYRLYNSPFKTTPGYSLVPKLHLELNANGTYTLIGERP